jgi:hypothetical protein
MTIRLAKPRGLDHDALVAKWIITIFLYLLGMGLFRRLGGFRAAGDALRRWGQAASTVKTRTRSR